MFFLSRVLTCVSTFSQPFVRFTDTFLLVTRIVIHFINCAAVALLLIRRRGLIHIVFQRKRKKNWNSLHSTRVLQNAPSVIHTLKNFPQEAYPQTSQERRGDFWSSNRLAVYSLHPHYNTVWFGRPWTLMTLIIIHKSPSIAEKIYWPSVVWIRTNIFLTLMVKTQNQRCRNRYTFIRLRRFIGASWYDYSRYTSMQLWCNTIRCIHHNVGTNVFMEASLSLKIKLSPHMFSTSHLQRTTF